MACVLTCRRYPQLSRLGFLGWLRASVARDTVVEPRYAVLQKRADLEDQMMKLSPAGLPRLTNAALDV